MDQFIYATTSIEFPQSFSTLDYFLTGYFQEQYDPSAISSSLVLFIDEKVEASTIPIEISPWKSLTINANMSQDQQEQLFHVL